jgi:hypothetical protein
MRMMLSLSAGVTVSQKFHIRKMDPKYRVPIFETDLLDLNNY